MEVEFRAAWMWVPVVFCSLVWVGWRRRMAWVVRRRAEEFNSCREERRGGAYQSSALLT